MSYVEHDENMQRQSLTFLASYDYVNSYCKKKNILHYSQSVIQQQQQNRREMQ